MWWGSSAKRYLSISFTRSVVDPSCGWFAFDQVFHSRNITRLRRERSGKQLRVSWKPSWFGYIVLVGERKSLKWKLCCISDETVQKRDSKMPVMQIKSAIQKIIIPWLICNGKVHFFTQFLITLMVHRQPLPPGSLSAIEQKFDVNDPKFCRHWSPNPNQYQLPTGICPLLKEFL